MTYPTSCSPSRTRWRQSTSTCRTFAAARSLMRKPMPNTSPSWTKNLRGIPRQRLASCQKSTCPNPHCRFTLACCCWSFNSVYIQYITSMTFGYPKHKSLLEPGIASVSSLAVAVCGESFGKWTGKQAKEGQRQKEEGW